MDYSFLLGLRFINHNDEERNKRPYDPPPSFFSLSSLPSPPSSLPLTFQQVCINLPAREGRVPGDHGGGRAVRYRVLLWHHRHLHHLQHQEATRAHLQIHHLRNKGIHLLLLSPLSSLPSPLSPLPSPLSPLHLFKFQDAISVVDAVKYAQRFRKFIASTCGWLPQK